MKIKMFEAFITGKPMHSIYPHASWFKTVKYNTAIISRRITITGIIALAIGGTGYLIMTHDKVAESYQAPTTVTTQVDEYETGVESVLNREEFKRQQALLAKEIFLKETKTQTQAEYDQKMTAIKAEFEGKLKKIETDLEAVRSEKITF